MADAEEKNIGHNLTDHLLGENVVHVHDEYSDHDHDISSSIPTSAA